LSDTPAISICIPAFQAARFLAETLATVRAQTFADWELIVVEDGSRDGTAQIVAEFATSVTQPVRYLRHEVNQGLTVTRNTGIAAARTAWIAILDSDDLWTSDHLATLWARASLGHADLVHAGSVLFDSDTGQDLEVRAPGAQTLAQFPVSLFESHYAVQPSSVLLAKALWERVGGFNPKFQHVEDREMWLRCARAGGRFAYTGRETCRYRKHAAAMSAESAAMAEASARVLDQHLDWDAIPPRTRRRLTAEAWASAARLRWRHEPALASQYFRRASALRWRPQWWLHGAICTLTTALRSATMR
jgi:glycosyltransferase involved in cell wall biosynthesis